jgi:hypothetical protein
MKAFIRIFILFLAGAMVLPSCTKVSEPYYTVKSVTIDTNNRTVLLEDYTGHLCVNCAPAASLAATIHDAYKGQVFVIAVHAGSFARPNPASFPPYLEGDYRCATGNDWYGYDIFNINVNPKGMVNRRQYNGNLSFGTTDWNEAVKVAAGLPKISFMKVTNTYNSQSKILTTKVDVKFLENYQGKVNLTVCILEDDIYGGQLNNIPPDSIPIIKNFRFMHVLRGSLNGSFGEEIAVNPATGLLITKSYSQDFTSTGWVPEHCSVIAFISDAGSKEVLHVAKSAELEL